MTNLFRYATLQAKSEKTWIECSIVKVISLFDVLSMLANCVWNNRGQDLEINRLFEVEKNIKIKKKKIEGTTFFVPSPILKCFIFKKKSSFQLILSVISVDKLYYCYLKWKTTLKILENLDLILFVPSSHSLDPL